MKVNKDFTLYLMYHLFIVLEKMFIFKFNKKVSISKTTNEISFTLNEATNSE